MRTWEPTAIGFSASTSAPDALMLSTRPRIILLLWSLSFPCDSFTGQQMGIRSATLVSPVPSGFGVAAVSLCGPVQERLIEIVLALARRYVRRSSIVVESPVPFNRAKSRTTVRVFRRELQWML